MVGSRVPLHQHASPALAERSRGSVATKHAPAPSTGHSFLHQLLHAYGSSLFGRTTVGAGEGRRGRARASRRRGSSVGGLRRGLRRAPVGSRRGFVHAASCSRARRTASSAGTFALRSARVSRPPRPDFSRCSDCALWSNERATRPRAPDSAFRKVRVQRRRGHRDATCRRMTLVSQRPEGSPSTPLRGRETRPSSPGCRGCRRSRHQGPDRRGTPVRADRRGQGRLRWAR